jgi:D-alanyl-D-alanine carboxypeptidase
MALISFARARIPFVALLSSSVLIVGAVYATHRITIDEDIAQSLSAASLAQGQLAAILASKLNVQLAQNATYAEQLAAREAADAQLQAVVGTIKGGLDHIEKERAVDPQLLQKYSRVYFLNENYRPAALLSVDARFAYPSTTPREIQAQALPFVTRLLTDADSASVHLRVLSSFRSFQDQSTLKKAYTVRYGSGSNAFSADQGYSEHQLGTAIDFTTAESGVLAGFDKTKGFAWLQANAYRYGFILSYPKGNDYYIYEPWHWRFVGIALATTLHDSGMHFYDMDQREIDTYRANMFDQ